MPCLLYCIELYITVKFTDVMNCYYATLLKYY